MVLEPRLLFLFLAVPDSMHLFQVAGEVDLASAAGGVYGNFDITFDSPLTRL